MGLVPSALTTQIRKPAPGIPRENAIRAPSGDQVGELSVDPSAPVTFRAPEPSLFTTQMSPPRENAIWPPSALTVGASVPPPVVSWVAPLPSGLIVQTS